MVFKEQLVPRAKKVLEEKQVREDTAEQMVPRV
jgi:hypothetical protein